MGGEAQSRFFAHVALEAMPAWFKACIARIAAPASIDPVRLGLRGRIGHARAGRRARGSRRSAWISRSEAIARARVRHPQLRFRVGDMRAAAGGRRTPSTKPATSRSRPTPSNTSANRGRRSMRWRCAPSASSCSCCRIANATCTPNTSWPSRRDTLPVARNGWVLVHAAARECRRLAKRGVARRTGAVHLRAAARDGRGAGDAGQPAHGYAGNPKRCASDLQRRGQPQLRFETARARAAEAGARMDGPPAHRSRTATGTRWAKRIASWSRACRRSNATPRTRPHPRFAHLALERVAARRWLR
jgi:hypothetical protein